MKETESGREQDAEIRRRHKALKFFLTMILGVDEDVAEVDVCRMDNAISEQTASRLTDFIDRINSEHIVPGCEL